MIGRLHGQLLIKQPPWLLIDVNGVGYEVEAPLSVFYHLPAVGERVTLLTHLLVREDAQLLYGFLHDSERSLFRLLLKVTGVGARLALVILSGMTAQQFARCIALEDVNSLCRLPGIGRKTAQRLVIELKERLAALEPAVFAAIDSPTPHSAAAIASDPLTDATSALIALGYKPADAQRMIQQVHSDGMTTEALLRAALRTIAPN
ncbi:Holliday junction branch migration protein RuvA [Rhodoferax sp. 4810]|uniref:Holliday junction branch migration complex subunit RuvA n=1 Tax=Thiospirillum jenense TaxID=1653858 RepID=A0A839H922_9GAMM|nr:Holliday junction branch migration protein RuvA [Thiospirillum jenense]MBB1073969.1 Holliday junction branch migration protein RuvA [Rhodoferax jenense]MBB1125845.1 Holliday junction branch migration protein RuvA [Thiospirillum jenense]